MDSWDAVLAMILELGGNIGLWTLFLGVISTSLCSESDDEVCNQV